MKKRSRPSIPDFSKKRPSGPTNPHDEKPQHSGRGGAPPPIVKPHATSSKSGRRGQ